MCFKGKIFALQKCSGVENVFFGKDNLAISRKDWSFGAEKGTQIGLWVFLSSFLEPFPLRSKSFKVPVQELEE